jgi:cytochrome c5
VTLCSKHDRPWAAVLLIALAAGACDAEPARVASAPLDPPLARTYQAVCAECHARPGIGAPLTGVDADWRERRPKGMDALLESTVAGYRGMPPLGECGRCSVDDFRKLIAYMAGSP